MNTLEQIMFDAITSAQNELAEWILPDSKTTDAEVLNKLLGILDNTELVKAMRSR